MNIGFQSKKVLGIDFKMNGDAYASRKTTSSIHIERFRHGIFEWFYLGFFPRKSKDRKMESEYPRMGKLNPITKTKFQRSNLHIPARERGRERGGGGWWRAEMTVRVLTQRGDCLCRMRFSGSSSSEPEVPVGTWILQIRFWGEIWS